jgi:sulfate permease, SulP family
VIRDRVRGNVAASTGRRFDVRAALRRRVRARPAGLRSDLAGGTAGATASLAAALSLGLLAFAPLGAEHAAIGVMAGFASAIYGQLIAGLLGGAAHPGSGPRASTSLVLAGLVAVLCADPALAPSAPQGVERVVALAGLAVLLGGVMQIVAGALGAGMFARYVPYPFIAGFMCGAAGLMIVAQLTPLTGITRAELARDPAAALRAVQPATFFVAATTATVIWTAAKLAKKVPSSILGLAAGTLLYYVIGLAFPAARLGAVVGTIPAQLPLPGALAALFAMPWTIVAPHLPQIVSTAAIIAVIGTLDGLFAAVSIDHATNGQHRTRREVMAHGVANIVTGLCGGVPVVLSRARTMASWDAGGRTRLTVVVAVLLMALALTLGAGLLAKVPVAVLGGIMVTLGVGLVDTWTRGLLKRLRHRNSLRDRTLLWSTVTIVAVALAAIVVGFIPAIAVGFVLSGVLFVVSMNRSLVRGVVDGTARPSRRVWGGEEAQRVQAARKRIRIVELEGALFFGSAERLSAQVERFGRDVDAVILDFRRVTAIDATGALLVERLVRRLAGKEIRVLLAGVKAGGRHGAALEAYGAFADTAARPWYPDADQAVEAAEHAALKPAGRAQAGDVPLTGFPLLEGIDGDDLERAIAHLTRRTFAAGEVLFQENEPGDRLCLLARGAVEISIMTSGKHRVRLVTMAAGSLFGEAALLDGRPRSAAAQAVEETVVYELTRAGLDDIAAQHPRIAIRIMANLARIMSQRMRETNEILRQLDDSRG